MGLDKFRKAYFDILKRWGAMVKPGGWAVFRVGDVWTKEVMPSAKLLLAVVPALVQSLAKVPEERRSIAAGGHVPVRRRDSRSAPAGFLCARQPAIVC